MEKGGTRAARVHIPAASKTQQELVLQLQYRGARCTNKQHTLMEKSVLHAVGNIDNPHVFQEWPQNTSEEALHSKCPVTCAL